MEFSNHNDLDLMLQLEHHGRPIRVADCTRFAVRVWTQNPHNFLLFTPRDIIKDDRRDRLVIPGYQMAALESGVVVYEYSYSLNDRHFKPFEGHPHDHRNRVVTDMYWKNCNLNQTPSNPVNYQTLNHLRDLIEQEVADRENAIIDVKQYLDESFVNDLREEIKRANEVDAELNNKINETKAATDEAIKAVSDKLDAEVKRSNEVDIELFNAIKKAGENTGNIKDETDGKIEEANTSITAEVERAKAAEREINTALETEVSRAKTKEAEIDGVIAAEVNRAKVVEGALTDGLDEMRNKANQIAADLAAEVSRSNQKDNDHTAAVNAEVIRATAAEKAITDRLDVIEGAKDVVGSIAHAVEDAKHYTDDEIAKLKTSTDTDLTNALKPYATKAEVDGRIEGIIGTAPAALDTLGEIADRLAGDNDAIAAINGVLNGKANSADVYTKSEVDAQHTTINTAVTALDGKVDAEANRAKAAEKVNADNLTALSGKVDGIKATADKAAADLTDEINRAKGVEAELSTKVNTVETKANTNADGIAALVDDMATLETSINGAKTDINGLTNDISAEVSRATTKENELEAGVSANAQKIADLTTRTSAVEGEVSTLSNDVDAVEAAVAIINGDETVIGSVKHGVSDSKHYTDDEISKLNAKVDAKVAGFVSVSALELKADKADVYTKDEVDAAIANVDVTAQLADYAKTADVAATYQPKGDYLTEHQDISGKADKSETYTKAQVDALGNQLKAIAEARLPIDSFNQWSEGVAMKSETTVVKDEAGNVITEMMIDNSAEDDTIEVYTKAQVDEIFAKKSDVPQIVTLTQAQYDALATKAPNTLYIVSE